MPISRDSAQRLMVAIEDCGRRLSSLLPALESELSTEEFRKMKREIGRVITTMDSSISAIVAHEFPDLAPEAVPIARSL